MSSSYSISQHDLLASSQLLVVPTVAVPQTQALWNGGPAVGTLNIVSQHLPGFELMEIIGELHQPLVVDAVDDTPWVGLLYQQQGAIESTVARQKRPQQVAAQQHNLRFERNQRSHHTMYPQRGRYQAFNIQVDAAFFTDLVQHNPDWQACYQRRLEEPEAFMLLPHNATPNAAVAQALSQLRQRPYAGALQRMFLEARFLDLLLAQHQQYQQPQPRVSRRDQDVFHAIRDFLDEHYAADLSLLGLARQFGINDCKLKQGFKALFGTTVFGYLAEKRLSTARDLLEASMLPVQEVGEAVGFGNAAHFATAFRRKFGVAPSRLRR